MTTREGPPGRDEAAGGGAAVRGTDARGPERPRSRPPTMQDVALATGVSRSTVSRILNDARLTVPIAPETRARVLDAAGRLGYRPNPLARALRGAPMMLLGAIVRDITDPFFAGAIEAVSAEARLRGYNIVLGNAHAEAIEAFALAAVLEARQCDAILLLGDMGDQPQLLADLRDTHVPVVALWQGSDLEPIPAVNVDNRAGIDAVMRHLEGLGHRRIAFIGGRLLGDIRERQAAYLDAMTRMGAPVDERLIRHVANTPADGEAAFGELMRLAVRPTAVVASTDVIAIGVLRGALTSGVRVPDELSVVGFDDIAMAAFTVPALTTVRMPTAEMAEAAISIAIEAAGHKDGNRDVPLVRRLPPELVVRDSTAPPGIDERRAPPGAGELASVAKASRP
ncbi:MAG TPA: LacI family DNA-binding transcriptional regulator [Candidatus Limnocylindrales bacterium]